MGRRGGAAGAGHTVSSSAAAAMQSQTRNHQQGPSVSRLTSEYGLTPDGQLVISHIALADVVEHKDDIELQESQQQRRPRGESESTSRRIASEASTNAATIYSKASREPLFDHRRNVSSYIPDSVVSQDASDAGRRQAQATSRNPERESKLNLNDAARMDIDRWRPILDGKGRAVRNHRILEGANRYFCDGRFLTSSDNPLSFLLSALIGVLLPTLFLLFSAEYISINLDAGGRVGLAFFVWSTLIYWTNMIKTAMSDPGILPRDLDPSPARKWIGDSFVAEMKSIRFRNGIVLSKCEFKFRSAVIDHSSLTALLTALRLVYRV